MKLDNIIYDAETLSSAITEQWLSDSPTFKALYPSETSTHLVNAFASYGAMLQYMFASYLANCYTSTAFSEQGVYQLAETLGNVLHGNGSSQVQVTLKKNNFIGINTVIPAETQFMIDGKKFFNPTAAIIPANSPSATEVILMQGEMIETTKTSSGIKNEKFYFSSDFKANHDYITVLVNGEKWEVVDSFIDYDKNYVLDSSELQVVIVRTDPDGKAYIQVGDNQLGLMPSSGSTITIRYASNDGANGNISEIGVIGSLYSTLIFTDNDGNQGALDLEVTTTSTAYGGFSKQSIDTLKQTSPYVFASGNRAVRRQDYRAMLQNKCGYLTSQVWGEYEEANKMGAYDALMMNMVYYTGLKSFETYPTFTVGPVREENHFSGMLASTKGFLGSFTISLKNLSNTTSIVPMQDNGGKGFLFINNNNIDPRDSLLADWNDDRVTIRTNDLEGEYETALQLHPIENAKSDAATYEYYQSVRAPSLLKPIQVIAEYDEPTAVAGIKFKAADSSAGTFIGSIAVYGTNISPMPSLGNVRNSKDWECLVNRTVLNRPTTITDNWTDWLPTNIFNGTKDTNGDPEFKAYQYYVIEFYSSEEVANMSSTITFNKMKMLYAEDASLLFYDKNGELDIKFPDNLINSEQYPMYFYTTTLKGITTTNGYKTGNILAYKYDQGGVTVTFLVNVINVDNGIYTVEINGDSVLTGITSIDLPSPASLDDLLVYEVSFDSSDAIAEGGTGYTTNDLVTLVGTNDQIVARVSGVNTYGEVLSLTFENRLSLGAEYNGTFETTTNGTGTGLKLNVFSTCMSGNGVTPARGATIDVTTSNNLEITASFTGNKIDTNDTNEYDQPIINKYNHFTTYLEFKQPEIEQISISAEVSLSTTASITSGIIIQNIKNNIQKLFEITPDYIGKGLKLSDIYTAIMNTPNVKWCRVLAPTDNVEVAMNKLLLLNTINITEIVDEFK